MSSHLSGEDAADLAIQAAGAPVEGAIERPDPDFLHIPVYIEAVLCIPVSTQAECTFTGVGCNCKGTGPCGRIEYQLSVDVVQYYFVMCQMSAFEPGSYAVPRYDNIPLQTGFSFSPQTFHPLKGNRLPHYPSIEARNRQIKIRGHMNTVQISTEIADPGAKHLCNVEPEIGVSYGDAFSLKIFYLDTASDAWIGYGTCDSRTQIYCAPFDTGIDQGQRL